MTAPRRRWFVWFAPITVPLYAVYVATMSIVAACYYITIEQTLAPIRKLWRQRAENDHESAMNGPIACRWIALAAVVLLVAAGLVSLVVAFIVARSLIPVGIGITAWFGRIPYVRQFRVLVWLALPVVFLVTIALTLTAIAVVVQVALW